MKKTIQESIDRMKLLFEYSFKPNYNESTEENPVKFSEIGDKYKMKPHSDYPTFEEYKDAVILDEAEPEDNEQPEPQNQEVQAPIDNNTQQQPEAQPTTPPPAPEVNNNQPVAAPPVQVPVDQTQVVPPSNDDYQLQSKIDDQINKTNELLAKFNNIQDSLSNIDYIQQQLNQISSEVESIKNPSLDDTVESILKQSYPFNVKMKDYFEKYDDEDDEPKMFTASPQEIESYNKEEIKNSFDV